MTSTYPARFSRFHAIISAKPGCPINLPPLADQFHPRSSFDAQEGTTERKKRKRRPDDEGSNQSRQFIRSVPDGELSKEKKASRFQSRQQLIDALRQRFKDRASVDFTGTYEVIEPGVTHKHRIQMVIHEIWKATGYRFTVKDHPPIKGGHKTRFWCSQDEAHRSKSSKAARAAQSSSKPRVSSAGDAVAKPRFPCRSRLLISSREASVPGLHIVTIRMHHHVAHEPYVDASLPPELAQAMWEGFGWIQTPSTSASIVADEEANSVDDRSPRETDKALEVGDSEEDEETVPQLNDDVDEQHEELDEPALTLDIHAHDPERYRQRMRAHISNLREFCDGLEYQLQFNDYRMLDVLEKEGGSFLRFVAECLQTEGRFVTPVSLAEPLSNASEDSTGDVAHQIGKSSSTLAGDHDQ